MSIPFNKYININSQIVATPVITNKQLILRIFTTNTLVPTNGFIEFNTAAEVGAYFGTSSVEYARAVKYFSWVSKNYNQPDTLSFASYVPVSEPPKIFGARFAYTLSQFQAITDGSFGLTLGAITHQISGLDFSAALSFADVAAIIETAVRAADVDVQWTGAIVQYKAVTNSFIFVGGNAVNAVISTVPGATGTDIQGILGWQISEGAIYSNGLVAQTITQTLQNSVDASNNFGSFLFMPYLDLAQAIEAATWNDTLDPNTQFIYSIAVNPADIGTYQASLVNFGGTCITKASPSVNDFSDQYTPQIFAATDYNQENSVQNYMYQEFPGDTPSVTTGEEAAALDAINVNYLGQTQQAGQPINFYQNGVMQGTPTDPMDINVYANEIWLKDAVGVSIMALLLAVGRVPANRLGTIQCLGTIQQNIDQALLNGMISVDKPLTPAQIAAIGNISGSPDAWYQVQNSGYWISGNIDPLNNLFSYTLIYSKDDTIKFVNGKHYLV